MRLIDKLIGHYGDRQKTATALGVHPETIRLWKQRGIPLERALDIERMSVGAITAEEVLREARALALASPKATA